MSEIAQVMNTIPQDKQQALHDKKQLMKYNIKYIQSEPRFGFGYDKIRRIYLRMTVIRLFKIQ